MALEIITQKRCMAQAKRNRGGLDNVYFWSRYDCFHPDVPPDFEQFSSEGKRIIQQRKLRAAFSFQQIGDIQFFSPDSFLHQPHFPHATIIQPSFLDFTRSFLLTYSCACSSTLDYSCGSLRWLGYKNVSALIDWICFSSLSAIGVSGWWRLFGFENFDAFPTEPFRQIPFSIPVTSFNTINQTYVLFVNCFLIGKTAQSILFLFGNNKGTC